MQRSGAMASLLAAIAAVANIVIVFAVLGAEIAGNPDAVSALALTNPAPLMALEGLKILSAACALVVVIAIQQRLAARGAPNTRLAALAGFAASALLTVAGLVGLFAGAQAGRAGGQGSAEAYAEIGTLVTYLWLFALLAHGFWYLLTSAAAMRAGGLPRRLSVLGYALGSANVIAFLLPPVTLLSLALGLAWSLWLGVFLWRDAANAS